MDPQVSIIILNWNGWQDTVECLESLYQINYQNYNIILVDNASSDESLQKIREYCNGKIKIKSDFFEYNFKNKSIKIFECFKEESEIFEKIQRDYSNLPPYQRLILIKNDENYGFAEGNNVGIRYALKSFNSEYILLLNNDTVVDRDFLKYLVNMAESDETIGFVGPKTFFYQKKNILQVAGGAKVDLRHCEVEEIGYNKVDDGTYDKYVEPDYIGGACILIKKEVVDKVGILDSNYFMYWEDADWCFSGREHGYKCVYAFKSKIWHKYGTSSTNYLKIYYLNRNRIYFMKKHSTKSQYTLFLIYFTLFILFECIYQLIRQRDVKMYSSLSKGLIDGFKINPQNSKFE